MSCYWGQCELNFAGLQGNSYFLAPFFFTFYLGAIALAGALVRDAIEVQTTRNIIFALLRDNRMKCAAISRAYIFQMPSFVILCHLLKYLSSKRNPFSNSETNNH
jgi:hypothetical protein